MTSSSDHQEGSAGITASRTTTRQDVNDEKTAVEVDTEKQQHPGNEQTTQIDPAVASRIAANVEDFMVR